MASADSLTFSLGGEDAIQCEECGVLSTHVRIANEVVVGGDTLGIIGVVRLDECGHVIDNAWADPQRVAQALDSDAAQYRYSMGPYSLGVED